MIGLDTNILVRYLVQDDVDQSKQATHIIGNEKTLFINHIVLCELVWVLDRAYNYEKSTILEVLERILQTRQFEIEEKHIVWQALAYFKNKRADFPNCLIGAKNEKAGCHISYTFDKNALSLPCYKNPK